MPPEKFDGIIKMVSDDNRIENKYINSNDVTDRYYDLEARISNKMKLEKRYQEILDKARNVRDILEVEHNLNQVRGEIESLQGQFKLLTNQISYGTLELSFYELVPYEVENDQRHGFGARVINSISKGWRGFQTFLITLVSLWPFGILSVFIIWLVRKLRKIRRDKQSIEN